MFDDFISALEEDEFEEHPVNIEEFVTNEDYLHLPPLSEFQYQAIKAMTQVYKKDTLIKLYGEEEGIKRSRQTCNEVILQLGKGSQTDSSLVWTEEWGYRHPSDLLDEYGYTVKGHRRDSIASAFFSEGEDDVFLVKTQKGHFVECNMSHEFFGWKSSRHGKQYSMKKEITSLPLAALIKGDILAINYGYTEPKNPVQITDDEALLIGYMLGDGTMIRTTAGKNPRNPLFTNATPEVQQDFVNIVERLGGEVVRGVSGFGCWNVRINKLNDTFRNLGLVQEYNSKKEWQGWWLNTTDRALRLIIEGLFATDGWYHIQRRGKETSVQMGWELNSQSLCLGIHQALTRLGIVSKFSQHRNKNSNHSETYRVSITSFKDALRLSRIINPRGKNLYEIIKTAEQLGIKEREPSFIYGDRIESIEYAGKKEIFTTIVEIDHSYTANGMIHANSGKDYISTISVTYLVYLLLCLKDPAKYFGKPPGDSIDIINIAINSEQARNVFFKGFRKRIEDSPWFVGKYNITAQSVSFDKSITCHSGHSERESWEGYNVICVILDEISGFSTVSTSGNEQAKTGQAIYDMYRASVDSRFPDVGKVVLLSFPRYRDDFIQQRYNAVIADKEVIIRSHTFKLDEELEGVKENEFTIEWEEDQINAYKYPKVFALKRPTWEVNPTRSINDFKIAFYNNPVDALGRFACMPPDAVDAFFKSKEKILACFNQPMNGVDDDGRFKDWFIPQDEKEYYIHVDLAQKHDHCAVAMSHVDRWVHLKSFMNHNVVSPIVVVDCVRWWTPTSDKSVDFSEVKQFIIDLRSRGFNIKKVTFDRWNSHDIMTELKMIGIETETLSVAKKHYDDMAMLVGEERIIGPSIKLLTDELLQLRIIRDKVDHPRKGSKDLSDAVCGSIYNAISNTRKQSEEIEIEVHTYKQFIRDQREEEAKRNVIQPPTGGQNNIDDYIQSIGMI